MLEYVTTHGAPFLARWDIHGATRENTDNGRCWLAVDDQLLLTLYRDNHRQHAVATAQLGVSGTAELAPVNDSGVSGTVMAGQPATVLGAIDVFYAADADLLARHGGVAAFLSDGNFAGREGFSEPCLRAKRVLDALLYTRLATDVLVDDLSPLAEPAACYALQFVYDYLSCRSDDPAAQLALRWRNAARDALTRVRISVGGTEVEPFTARVLRA